MTYCRGTKNNRETEKTSNSYLFCLLSHNRLKLNFPFFRGKHFKSAEFNTKKQTAFVWLTWPTSRSTQPVIILSFQTLRTKATNVLWYILLSTACLGLEHELCIIHQNFTLRKSFYKSIFI